MQQDAQETEVLDAEPQEVELEVELESSEPEQPTEPVEQTDQDLENYSASVNKRISKLTAKMREAERRASCHRVCTICATTTARK